MGSGIAEVCARRGLDVCVVETDATRVNAARNAVSRSLARAVRSRKLTAEEAEAAEARVTVTAELADLAGAEAVLEAIAENEGAKRELFGRLDALLPDAAFLASNTSSVPIMRLGAATTRPDRVLGLHFFNPAPVLPLVELVPSLATSEATLAAARRFAEDALGKTTIVAPDRAGFVVNALLVPYLLAAVRMVEGGLASREDIDAGMVTGCAHPIGPLALADLIGLDTLLAIAERLHEELPEAASVAPPLLRRMVEAGRLGRKSGEGFYRY